MSRPMTRLMTTAVATNAAPASPRRWGLRTSTTAVNADRPEAETLPEDAGVSFWEYYCLAFC